MKSQNTRDLLVFEISGVNFALPLSKVEEVVPCGKITNTPHAPPFFLGLAAVRGKVLGVIDASRRFGLSFSLNAYFLVCHVRGNLTAITIDRPVLAGAMIVRDLDDVEFEMLRAQARVDSKFLKGGFELTDIIEDNGNIQTTSILCLEVEPDFFVSTEMAIRVGEAS